MLAHKPVKDNEVHTSYNLKNLAENANEQAF